MSTNNRLFKKKIDSSYSLSLKAISALLVLSFFVQDLAFANPDPALSAPITLKAPSLKISKSVAQIEDSYLAQKPSQTVYLIQDAHTNLSAQKNIATLLDTLVSQKDVTDIFVEGGVGDESLAYLRKLAPRSTRTRVGQHFLNRGWIQGANFFDLLSDKNFKVHGLEDRSVYFASLEEYRWLYSHRESLNHYLDQYDQALQILKPRVFNPILLKLGQMKRAADTGGAPLLEYLRALLTQWVILGNRTDSFPHLGALSNLKDDASEEEIEKLLLPQIWSEKELLEQNIWKAFTLSSDQRELLRISSALPLLRHLVNLKLTPQEYAFIQEHPSIFNLAWIADFINTQRLKASTQEENALILDRECEKVIERALKFYALTNIRNEIFVERIQKRLDPAYHKNIAVIVGGFHARGIKPLLKAKNISYVSILPSVIEETNEKKYETLLLGRPINQFDFAPRSIYAKSLAVLSPKLLTVDPSNARVVSLVGKKLRQTLSPSVSQGARLSNQPNWLKKLFQDWFPDHRSQYEVIQVPREAKNYDRDNIYTSFLPSKAPILAPFFGDQTALFVKHTIKPVVYRHIQSGKLYFTYDVPEEYAKQEWSVYSRAKEVGIDNLCEVVQVPAGFGRPALYLTRIAQTHSNEEMLQRHTRPEDLFLACIFFADIDHTWDAAANHYLRQIGDQSRVLVFDMKDSRSPDGIKDELPDFVHYRHHHNARSVASGLDKAYLLNRIDELKISDEEKSNMRLEVNLLLNSLSADVAGLKARQRNAEVAARAGVGARLAKQLPLVELYKGWKEKLSNKIQERQELVDGQVNLGELLRRYSAMSAFWMFVSLILGTSFYHVSKNQIWLEMMASWCVTIFFYRLSRSEYQQKTQDLNQINIAIAKLDQEITNLESKVQGNLSSPNAGFTEKTIARQLFVIQITSSDFLRTIKGFTKEFQSSLIDVARRYDSFAKRYPSNPKRAQYAADIKHILDKANQIVDGYLADPKEFDGAVDELFSTQYPSFINLVTQYEVAVQDSYPLLEDLDDTFGARLADTPATIAQYKKWTEESRAKFDEVEKQSKILDALYKKISILKWTAFVFLAMSYFVGLGFMHIFHSGWWSIIGVFVGGAIAFYIKKSKPYKDSLESYNQQSKKMHELLDRLEFLRKKISGGKIKPDAKKTETMIAIQLYTIQLVSEETDQPIEKMTPDFTDKILNAAKRFDRMNSRKYLSNNKRVNLWNKITMLISETSALVEQYLENPKTYHQDIEGLFYSQYRDLVNLVEKYESVEDENSILDWLFGSGARLSSQPTLTNLPTESSRLLSELKKGSADRVMNGWILILLGADTAQVNQHEKNIKLFLETLRNQMLHGAIPTEALIVLQSLLKDLKNHASLKQHSLILNEINRLDEDLPFALEEPAPVADSPTQPAANLASGNLYDENVYQYILQTQSEDEAPLNSLLTELAQLYNLDEGDFNILASNEVVSRELLRFKERYSDDINFTEKSQLAEPLRKALATVQLSQELPGLVKFVDDLDFIMNSADGIDRASDVNSSKNAVLLASLMKFFGFGLKNLESVQLMVLDFDNPPVKRFSDYIVNYHGALQKKDQVSAEVFGYLRDISRQLGKTSNYSDAQLAQFVLDLSQALRDQDLSGARFAAEIFEGMSGWVLIGLITSVLLIAISMRFCWIIYKDSKNSRILKEFQKPPAKKSSPTLSPKTNGLKNGSKKGARLVAQIPKYKTHKNFPKRQTAGPNAAQFIARVYNAQRSEWAGKRAVRLPLGGSVLHVQIGEGAKPTLTIHGLGDRRVKISDYKATILQSQTQALAKTEIPLAQFKRVITNNKNTLASLLANSPKDFYSKPVVQVIDLDSLYTQDWNTFAPYFAAVLQKQHAQPIGQNSVVMLKGKDFLITQLREQYKALFKIDADFIYSPTDQLPQQFLQATKIFVTAVDERSIVTADGQQKFFIRKWTKRGVPDLESYLNLALVQARLDNFNPEKLNIADGRLNKYLLCYQTLLGSPITNVHELVRVLSGYESSPVLLLRYALLPISILVSDQLLAFELTQRSSIISA